MSKNSFAIFLIRLLTSLDVLFDPAFVVSMMRGINHSRHVAKYTHADEALGERERVSAAEMKVALRPYMDAARQCLRHCRSSPLSNAATDNLADFNEVQKRMGAYRESISPRRSGGVTNDCWFFYDRRGHPLLARGRASAE